MRLAYFLAVSILSSTVAASPVITSITPNSSPTQGGVTVVIRGTGFTDNCVTCSPPIGEPTVYFGGAEAQEVTYVSSTELRAVTPPHIPGNVDVMLVQADGSDPNWYLFQNGFAYQGNVFDAYEPVLFPIFVPPIRGQNGSEFRTTAKFWNRSHNQAVTFYGFDTNCTLIDPPLQPENPFYLQPRGAHALDLYPACNGEGGVGKLFYIPKGNDSLSASLRVSETSRQAENHGVEIPVAFAEDFSSSIALVDVPIDPKYRLTLRVYGLNRGENLVNLWFGNDSGTMGPFNSFQLPLQPGRTIFEPSYAVFTDFRPAEGFPPFAQTINVLLTSQSNDGPIWGFITVTNNQTQHITTVTPQQ